MWYLILYKWRRNKQRLCFYRTCFNLLDFMVSLSCRGWHFETKIATLMIQHYICYLILRIIVIAMLAFQSSADAPTPKTMSNLIITYGTQQNSGWWSWLQTLRPVFEPGIQHIKQFAHDWYLPCCQCTETRCHVSFIQNSHNKAQNHREAWV